MDAVKFLKEKNRMCKIVELCSDCPLHNMCSPWIGFDEEKAVKSVEKWSKEHPIKTRESEFLKQYPNAAVNSIDHLPEISPCMLDQSVKERLCKRDFSCPVCREKYWLEEIE